MTAPVPVTPETLRETVAGFVHRKPITIERKDHFCDHLGLDSIDRLNLLAEIETRHDVTLSGHQIAEIQCLDDLTRALCGDMDEETTS